MAMVRDEKERVAAEFDQGEPAYEDLRCEARCGALAAAEAEEVAIAPPGDAESLPVVLTELLEDWSGGGPHGFGRRRGVAGPRRGAACLGWVRLDTKRNRDEFKRHRRLYDESRAALNDPPVDVHEAQAGRTQAQRTAAAPADICF